MCLNGTLGAKSALRKIVNGIALEHEHTELTPA